MPRNGSGVYSLVTTPFATAGQIAVAAPINANINDLGTEITGSLPRNGSAGMTADLTMGSNKITGLAAATAAGNALRYEQLIGKQTIYLPAGALIPRTTNGAAPGSAETATNKIMRVTLNFDTTTEEFAQAAIRMPKGWNESTVTFIPQWSHPATVTNFGVVWSFSAVAISDDDAYDAAFGTAVTSTDTGGTTDDLYQGPETAACTIAGTPAEGDTVVVQISRAVANGSDTLAVDARLHGFVMLYTINIAADD